MKLIDVLTGVSILFMVILLGIGSWFFERKVNWTLGYNKLVIEEVTPLEERIERLEKFHESALQDLEHGVE